MIELESRYRLTAPRPDDTGATWWTAHDAVLDKSVDVMTLAEADPRAARVVAAARAAGTLTEPRLQHVVDVGVSRVDEVDVAYVVFRQAPGRPLADVVADGPLDPARAAKAVADAAAALGHAHRAGQGHGALTAQDIVVDDDTTTVCGLGVTAALTGVATTVVGDTRALAAALYTALTSRRPTTPGTPGDLAPAPTSDGWPVRPRMVRAGVPGVLDEITARAMALPGAEPTIDDPDHLAAELQQYLTAVRQQRLRDSHRGSTAPEWPWSRVAAVAAGTLILVGAGLVGWQAWSQARTPSPRQPDSTATSPVSASPTAGSTRVAVADVRVLDPYGDGTENDDQAPLAVDGDPATSWTTLNYASRDLGGLKSGVGLELDFARSTSVSAVSIALVGRGTDLSLFASDHRGSGDLTGYTRFAQLRGIGDRVTVPLTPPITCRSLVIWLTALPSNGTTYTGGVAEVVVTS